MSHGLSALDRILAFLIGLIALALGVWGLAFAFNVPVAHDAAGTVGSWSVGEQLAHWSYMPLVLVIVAVLGIVLGLWLLISNLRIHRFNTMRAEGDDERGTVVLSVRKLADAAGQSLAQHPGVNDVRVKTRKDRGHDTVTWTIHADPRVDIASLSSQIDQTNEYFHAAIENLDVDTRFLLELAPVG